MSLKSIDLNTDRYYLSGSVSEGGIGEEQSTAPENHAPLSVRDSDLDSPILQLVEKIKSGEIIVSSDIVWVLEMFPYPSGKGLHMGHLYNYSAGDIYSRMQKLLGKTTIHRFGFDSFGLPAENYARDEQSHPADITQENIQNFLHQMKDMHIDYDYSKVTVTSNPEYYRNTQHLFAELYEAGLINREIGTVNYCPSCETQIANSEAVGGVCSRCKSSIEYKKEEELTVDILQYADRLLEMIQDPRIDIPDATKKIMTEWIGKKEGYSITFEVDGGEEKIASFIGNEQHLLDARAIIIAPEHPIVDHLAKDDINIIQFRRDCLGKSPLQRKKDIVCHMNTGLVVTNPLTGAHIPVHIGGFVFDHDHGSSIVVTAPIKDNSIETNFPGYSESIADQFTAQTSTISSSTFSDLLLDEKVAQTKLYNLNSRSIGRTRYRGTPIPLIYPVEYSGSEPKIDADGKYIFDTTNPQVLDVSQYPVELPRGKNRGDHTYSLKDDEDFSYITIDGKLYAREKRTMDSYVDSSFYHIMYIVSQLENVHSNHEYKQLLEAIGSIDVYIGGQEHAQGHLLYMMFIHSFLKEKGYVTTEFPFKKLIHQGMILGYDGSKMSKSKKNGVDYAEAITYLSSGEGTYDGIGSDVLKLYVHSLGKFHQDNQWKFVYDDVHLTHEIEGTEESFYQRVNKDGSIDYFYRISDTSTSEHEGDVKTYQIAALNEDSQEKIYVDISGVITCLEEIKDEDGEVIKDEAGNTTYEKRIVTDEYSLTKNEEKLSFYALNDEGKMDTYSYSADIDVNTSLYKSQDNGNKLVLIDKKTKKVSNLNGSPNDEVKANWKNATIHSYKRILIDIHNFTIDSGSTPSGIENFEKLIDDMVKDIQNFKFNTLISKIHQILNQKNKLTQEQFVTFLIHISPIVPALANEKLEQMGKTDVANSYVYTGLDALETKDTYFQIFIQGKGLKKYNDNKDLIPNIDLSQMNDEAIANQLRDVIPELKKVMIRREEGKIIVL